MSQQMEKPEDLNKYDLARLIIDMFHRMVVHHSLWFTEIKHQMGMEKALDALDNVFQKSFPLQIKRLSKVLGFDLYEEVPKALLDKPKDTLIQLLDNTALNWLANDGIWFQEVEFSNGMNDAKRCNDSCWAQFSPVEAYFIKKLLRLSEHPGLEGLKKALDYRLYGRINTQSISDETENSFVFQMNECRVQVARKRKGLEDYPCKSVGLVEYPYFAKAIDSRITTECIGCPPDNHPDEWFCAWKFVLTPDEP